MAKQHTYHCTIQWTGNTGSGTASYYGYERSHTISIPDKPVIAASSDPAFRGDATKYNPEELLLASLSSCHMLWFLHLCAAKGIVVTHYTDEPIGTMEEATNGSGRFIEVILKPNVTIINGALLPMLPAIHTEANKMCFIANSVNFPIMHQPAAKAL